MGALGHGGHGKHKNKASGGYLGSCRPGFGTYGRGNFPGHDVFGVLSKMLKIACRWMQIGSDGCNRVCGHGEQQKQGKKSVNWVSRACFVMYVHNAKKKEVDSDGHTGQRGSFEGMESKQEVCGTL